MKIFTQAVKLRQNHIEKTIGLRPCLHVNENNQVTLAKYRKIVNSDRLVKHIAETAITIGICYLVTKVLEA